MQTQTINTDLCRWLDEKCQRIEHATDGRVRYHAYRGAMADLGCNDAPLTWGANENGFWHDQAEKDLCFQALVWCALAAGVKTETVKNVYDRMTS